MSSSSFFENPQIRSNKNKRLLLQFPDFGMDGMRCDVEGNLYITRYGKGTVAKVSPEGEVLREVQLTGKNPSNIAFGGPDGRTCYVDPGGPRQPRDLPRGPARPELEALSRADHRGAPRKLRGIKAKGYQR